MSLRAIRNHGKNGYNRIMFANLLNGEQLEIAVNIV